MQAGAHYVGGLDPPVSMARWKNPSIPCSRLRWIRQRRRYSPARNHSVGRGSHNYMVETVEKTPQLKGKLTISTPLRWLRSTNNRSMNWRIGCGAANFYRLDGADWHAAYAAKQLHDKGVKVMTGTDSVIDHGRLMVWATCWKKPISTRSSNSS